MNCLFVPTVHVQGMLEWLIRLFCKTAEEADCQKAELG